MKKGWVLVWAVGLGAANALIFKAFEEVVNQGLDLIWNGWLATDTERWRVVPVAIGLGLVFGMVLRQLRQPRWVKPETGLGVHGESHGKVTLGTIGSILTVGASGLLAGASLGPEMPLAESSQALGRLASDKLRAPAAASTVLVMASLGSLLVAFFASIILVILPLTLVYQKSKQLTLAAAGPILLAGLSSYGVLWLMDHNPHGYGSIPAAGPSTGSDYWGVVVVSLCVSLFALALVRAIKFLGGYTRRIDQLLPWYASAALFGLVLGVLYWIGGQPVQFNGSVGSSQLVHDAASYGTWAFLGLAAVKLLATAWSKTTGYRGGLFFPSIFAGVAISLFIGSLFGSLSGPGTTIGAIAAIFMAISLPDKPEMTPADYISSGIIAFLFMAALLPIALAPLVLLATMGAALGNKALGTLLPAPAEKH
jgi:H+/Cl- antiporter ClcA